MAKWTIPRGSNIVPNDSPIRDADLWTTFINRFKLKNIVRAKTVYYRSAEGFRYDISTLTSAAGELWVEGVLRAKTRLIFEEQHVIVALVHIHQIGRFVIKFRSTPADGSKITFYRSNDPTKLITERQINYRGLEIEYMYAKFCAGQIEDTLKDDMFMLSLLL